MNNISFDNPWLLFLAIPMLVAVIVPFAITVRRDNANFHNVTSCVLHVIICICITLVISGMSINKMITETNVYVLADVSYSTTHNDDEIQESLNKISEKLPKNSKMGVICFGRNYQLISDMGEKVPNVSSADQVDKSATDIASALRYAGNLFDDDVIKRIIVITDGAETVTTNNILKVVGSLQESGVYVDAVYLNDNIADETKEIQIDGVEVTKSTYLNKEEEVNVLVRANCGITDGTAETRIDGYVNLYKNGVAAERRTASFYPGINFVTLPLQTDEEGSFEYEITVETVNPDDDSSPHNNRYLFTQSVTNERKVLFLGGTDADVSAGAEIYGYADVEYITHENVNAKIPLSVEDLCVYDEIVMCNFDVRKILAYTMFFNSLTTLIDDYGKTLTTYGNTYIQEDNGDASGEALRLLSKLLPVQIGNFDQEERLIAIVLDISTSTNFSSRMVVAKRAAIELINSLNAKDRVMVVGFSGGVTELLPPTQLTSTKVIIDTINACEGENETKISAALTLTKSLMGERYRYKQVFLISDGLNNPSDESAAKAAVSELHRSNIIVSALGIYPDAYGDNLLREMINNGEAEKGSFYKKIASEQDIDFTIGEITEETRKICFDSSEDEFNDYYRVNAERSYESVLDGVGNIESVYGFWCSSADGKPSNVVLSVTYMRDAITPVSVPLYAYWSGGGKGNGKVVSFLSDISSPWTRNWSANSNGSAFLSNIPDATLPDEKIVTPFLTDIVKNVNVMTVYVNASLSLQNSTAFTVTVTDPNGLSTTKNLSYDSSSYFANFNTDAIGTYTVRVEYSYNGLKYETTTDYAVSYGAEYDSFTNYSVSSLYRLLTSSGNILNLDELKRIENVDSSYTTYVFSFTMPLMIVCAVLFLADIIIRQLKWKDVTSFFGGIFRRRK